MGIYRNSWFRNLDNKVYRCQIVEYLGLYHIEIVCSLWKLKVFFQLKSVCLNAHNVLDKLIERAMDVKTESYCGYWLMELLLSKLDTPIDKSLGLVVGRLVFFMSRNLDELNNTLAVLNH